MRDDIVRVAVDCVRRLTVCVPCDVVVVVWVILLSCHCLKSIALALSNILYIYKLVILIGKVGMNSHEETVNCTGTQELRSKQRKCKYLLEL